jgi:hypothetical protein
VGKKDRKRRKTMNNKNNEENSFCRRSATDAVERLSKRSCTESVKAKAHFLSPSNRVGIGKSIFGSLRPVEQDLSTLGFPVIEWDSDNEDGSDHSFTDSEVTDSEVTDSEGVDEALCRDTAKFQVLSTIATIVRPPQLSHPRVPVMLSGRECGLVRSKAFQSRLSLLDSRSPSRHGGRVGKVPGNRME